MWHQLYNKMLLGLSPPFSQHLSTSQNPQISGTQQLCLFADNGRAHELSLLIAEENNQVISQAREGMRTEVSQHGDKGWFRPRHRISIIDTMIAMCNNRHARIIRCHAYSYNTTTGLISWPTLTTHCRRYLQYVTKISFRAIRGVNGGTQISNH